MNPTLLLLPTLLPALVSDHADTRRFRRIVLKVAREHESVPRGEAFLPPWRFILAIPAQDGVWTLGTDAARTPAWLEAWPEDMRRVLDGLVRSAGALGGLVPTASKRGINTLECAIRRSGRSGRIEDRVGLLEMKIPDDRGEPSRWALSRIPGAEGGPGWRILLEGWRRSCLEDGFGPWSRSGRPGHPPVPPEAFFTACLEEADLRSSALPAWHPDAIPGDVTSIVGDLWFPAAPPVQFEDDYELVQVRVCRT